MSLFTSGHVCKRFRLFDLEMHDPDVHFFLIPEIPFSHARTILKSLIPLAGGKSRRVVSKRGDYQTQHGSGTLHVKHFPKPDFPMKTQMLTFSEQMQSLKERSVP